jgi:hypothetical protein
MQDQEYTQYQKGIIRRYYRNQQELAFQKIEEMIPEIYLAETDKKRDALWKRVEKAMANLKVPAAIADHILKERKPDVLANNLRDWWRKLPKKPPEERPEP